VVPRELGEVLARQLWPDIREQIEQAGIGDFLDHGYLTLHELFFARFMPAGWAASTVFGCDYIYCLAKSWRAAWAGRDGELIEVLHSGLKPFSRTNYQGKESPDAALSDRYLGWVLNETAMIWTNLCGSRVRDAWSNVGRFVAVKFAWSGEERVMGPHRPNLDSRRDVYDWAFFEYLAGMADVSLPDRVLALTRLARQVDYCWTFTNTIVLCERPVVIAQDSFGRLHRDFLPAIKYADGFGIHARHGEMMNPGWSFLWQSVWKRRPPQQKPKQ
jgi:hypothetical protein